MMTDLQAIDLILSIALKILFIIFLIFGTVVLIQANSIMRQIKDRVAVAIENLETSMWQIENNLRPENLYNKIRYGVERSANLYFSNFLNKQVYSVLKKFIK